MSIIESIEKRTHVEIFMENWNLWECGEISTMILRRNLNGMAMNTDQLEAENETLRFACKQALMAFEDGYDAPKIRQDLRDALLT